MSTKIYDAFKYNGSIIELKEDLKVYKENILNAMIPVVFDNFNDLMQNKKDQLKQIWVWWMDLERLFAKMLIWETEGQADKIEVIVFHDKNWDIYCMFFGGTRFTELLPEKFEDFHYQNSTDKPDDVSDEDWWARSSKWDEIMPTWIPSKDGFVYTILDLQGVQVWFRDYHHKKQQEKEKNLENNEKKENE